MSKRASGFTTALVYGPQDIAAFAFYSRERWAGLEVRALGKSRDRLAPRSHSDHTYVH